MVYGTLQIPEVFCDFNKLSESNGSHIKCKICQEMFKYNFDFDKITQDTDIKNIFPKDKLETVAKEISMQYFFKGAESQFESMIPVDVDFSNCKFVNTDEKCERLKKKLCENLLSFEKHQCEVKADYNFKKKNDILFKDDFKNNDQNKFNKMSLIQLTPEFIGDNFDSTPKVHWKPPKPVLLQNFENSIGTQLKEISQLTSY